MLSPPLPDSPLTRVGRATWRPGFSAIQIFESKTGPRSLHLSRSCIITTLKCFSEKKSFAIKIFYSQNLFLLPCYFNEPGLLNHITQSVIMLSQTAQEPQASNRVGPWEEALGQISNLSSFHKGQEVLDSEKSKHRIRLLCGNKEAETRKEKENYIYPSPVCGKSIPLSFWEIWNNLIFLFKNEMHQLSGRDLPDILCR